MMFRRTKLYLKSLIIAAGLVFIFNSVQAQVKVVKGVVREKSTNETLIGANVIIKNSNDRFIKGTTTDLNGNYTLDVTIDDAILQVSYIGYLNYEVEIGSKTVIDVELEPDSKSIDEVKVVAAKKASNGYMDVDLRDLSSSVASIDITKIATSSATSVEEMLQGQATGVQVTANSGDPGAGFNIQIRGNTSLNGSNNPLIVVDGVPLESDISVGSVSDLTSSHSPLSDVNPEDIETITILKDAGATAIYGSRGANGVIVIDTKRGRKNQTMISFSSNYSVQMAPENIPLLSGDDYKILILEGTQNAGGGDDLSSISYPQLRDDPTRNDFYYYNNNTNWLDEIQQTGQTFNNTLSLRGGGDKTAYNISMGYTDQTGTTRGTGYSRFTTNMNLDATISKKLEFKTSMGYSRSKRDQGGKIDGWKQSIETARVFPSFYPVYHQDEETGEDLDQLYVIKPRENIIYNENYYNPYAWTEYVESMNYTNSLKGNLTIVYDIVRGLRLTSRVTAELGDNNSEGFVPESATNHDWNNSKVNVSALSNSNSKTVNQENILSYNRTFADIHDLSVVGVTRYRWWRNSVFKESSSNSGSDGLRGVNATNRWNNLESSSNEDKSNALIGQLNYKLKNRYILNGAISYEGSSKFGEDNRYGTFPTIGASWVLSEESFMQGLNFLDYLKFRYQWGRVGNQPNSNYLYFNKYTAGSRYLDGIGVVPDNIQLNTLQWETTTSQNLGLDLTVFDNRLTTTVEMYEMYTEDLLVQKSLPSTSGYGNYWTNFGDIRNRGIEFSTNIRILEQTKFKWRMSFNITFNENQIMYLPNDGGVETSWENGYPIKVEVGHAVGTFYGYRSLGVFPTDDDAVVRDQNGNIVYDFDGEPKRLRFEHSGGYEFQGGDAQYEDINHDGLINDKDIVKIGDANPDYFGGLTSNFSYGNWKLDAFFQYNIGNDILNISRMQLESMGGGERNNSNQATSVLRRWRKQGDITDIPRVTFDNQAKNALGSDRFVEDGSYIRFKSLSLSYNIPNVKLEKLKIRNVTVYATAYNFLTWTNYKGVDPEISLSANNPWAVGRDIHKTPVSKSFTLGLKISFN